MRHIGGILLYLRQEGRGIGLYNKLDAYGLQDQGLDTYAANRALDLDEDGRAYTVAAQMLQALEVWSCRLLTNNPDKVEQLVAHGIDVVERVSTGVYASAANYRYLAAKKQRALHAIDLPALEDLI
jgi:GTP cyclohydrolase II